MSLLWWDTPVGFAEGGKVRKISSHQYLETFFEELPGNNGHNLKRFFILDNKQPPHSFRKQSTNDQDHPTHKEKSWYQHKEL